MIKLGNNTVHVLLLPENPSLLTHHPLVHLPKQQTQEEINKVFQLLKRERGTEMVSNEQHARLIPRVETRFFLFS